MKHRSAFCTLDAVLRQLAMGNSKKTDYDLNADIDALIATIDANNLTRIRRLIYDQSAQLYDVVNRVGSPYEYTWILRGREYRAMWSYDRQLGAHILALPDDLLAVSALTINGTVLVENTDFYTRLDGFPKIEIAIPAATAITWPSAISETIDLTGIWGYHQRPTAMWINSTDSVQGSGGINASVASVTVSDADGNNDYSVKRFETLQYIKIDDEFMLITALNTTSNVLTVIRGANGTTATTHAESAAIYTLETDDVFEEAVRRRVVFLYHNPSETRRVVPLPDGTVQLDDESRIPLPPTRYYMGAG